MVNNQVSVATPGMLRAAENFTAAISDSRRTHGMMQAEMATLGAAWTGEASAKFNQSLNRWCSEYQNIITQLKTLLHSVEASAQSYSKGEHAAIDMAGGAMRGLSGL